MSGAVYSPAAITDINDIWDYTAGKWGADQADRYTDGIRDACIDLAKGRKQGRPVDVRDGYLKCSVRRHSVFYVSGAEGITVIRVLHQSMDPERHL